MPGPGVPLPHGTAARPAPNLIHRPPDGRGYHPAIGTHPSPQASTGISWTFLTTHGLVLLAIAEQPDIRLRDVAERVGITERAVQRLVADLIEGGYLTRSRVGRRNTYRVHGEVHLPHPTTRHQEVGALMRLLAAPKPRKTR
jgi:MarR family